MPSFKTKNFGEISYELDLRLEFPAGLPGFEARRQFATLQFPDTKPLIFLQSLEDPDLCFLTFPVLAVDPQYQLAISEEDRRVAGLPQGRPLRIGEDVICLTVLSLRESGPTANLLAPIVINLHTRQAVQAVAADSPYSHQHVLVAEEAPVCS